MRGGGRGGATFVLLKLMGPPIDPQPARRHTREEEETPWGRLHLQLHLAIASRTPSTIAPSTIVPSTTPISMASNELRTPSTMGFLCYFLSPITGLGFYKICLTKEVLDFSSSSNYKHLAI